MMVILMSETCLTNKKWNKIASDIKLVFCSSSFQNILEGSSGISKKVYKKGIYEYRKTNNFSKYFIEIPVEYL